MKKSKYKPNIQSINHFVYKWKNSKTKEYYIGKHSGQTDDGYTGSGVLFREKYKESPKDWTRTIVAEKLPSSKSALNVEAQTIGNLWEIDPLCLNLCPGGGGAIKISDEKQKELAIKKKLQNFHSFHTVLFVAVKNQFVFLGKNIDGTKTTWFDTTPKITQKILDVVEKNDFKIPKESVHCVGVSDEGKLEINPKGFDEKQMKSLETIQRKMQNA